MDAVKPYCSSRSPRGPRSSRPPPDTRCTGAAELRASATGPTTSVDSPASEQAAPASATARIPIRRSIRPPLWLLTPPIDPMSTLRSSRHPREVLRRVHVVQHRDRPIHVRRLARVGLHDRLAAPFPVP